MRGESGRSLDSGERGLERLLDAAMRRRIRDDSVTLADVLTLARQLHDYRDGNSLPAHLDDRVGVLDDNERVIAELLVSEGRNVTHVVRRKSGEPTPDLVVDGEFAEVKTSRVQAFKNELWIVVHIQPDVYNLQTTDRIVKLVDGDFLFLNAVIKIIVIYSQL